MRPCSLMFTQKEGNSSIIIQIYCCIIKIFVLSCRTSWQACGAGEAVGQVFRGWVIHGLWNGLCYKFYEYSCTHRKSKGFTINTNNKSNGMLRIFTSNSGRVGKNTGNREFIFFYYYWNTPKDHICTLTDLFGSFTQEMYHNWVM